MVRNHMNTTVREEYEGMEYELWLYASEYGRKKVLGSPVVAKLNSPNHVWSILSPPLATIPSCTPQRARLA